MIYPELSERFLLAEFEGTFLLFGQEGGLLIDWL